MNLIVIFAIFFALYSMFIWNAHKFHPLIYLTIFTYYVQYIFSVYLIYNEYPSLRRQMPISQSELFSYLIPAVILQGIGALMFKKDIDLSKFVIDINPAKATRMGHLLLGISLVSDVLTILFPAFGSIRSFTNYLKYGAFMCYIFNMTTFNMVLMAVIFMNLLRDALLGGVFIDFFMWCTHFFLMFTYRFQLSFAKRASFILIAAPVLILIQSIKHEYRLYTWSGRKESGLGTFTELVLNQKTEEDAPLGESTGVISTVARLNQGWHVAKVLKHVPSKVPFSNGEEFISDVEGVILPRIFFPEKKNIGSHSKFEYYTGHRLHNNTSMTIGVFGDFYVNFGLTGALVAAFLFGALMARSIYWFTNKFVTTSPLNIIWVPILFGYFARANNDFYTVLNSMFKGFLIFLFVQFVYKLIWPEPRTRPVSAT